LESQIRIRDNVHGEIAFPDHFQDLLANKYFKRLHSITQMGMARQVFPAAVHTRFSHSLGTYHVMSKLVNINSDYKLTEQDKFCLLAAALYHDIGHLPLSHTIEQAMVRYDRANTTIAKMQIKRKNSLNMFYDSKASANKGGGVPNSKAALHEILSAAVVSTSTITNKIRNIFEYVGGTKDSSAFESDRITYGILGESQEDGETREYIPFFKIARFLLHSQLDADRLDYLMRDSMTTGIKAGGFDIDKLISEIKILDDNGSLYYGILEGGIRSLEEYLLMRIYNYLEIVYNPVSYGLGLLAEEFYFQLLLLKHYGYINDYYRSFVLTSTETLDKILFEDTTEGFRTFDDNTFYSLVESARKSAEGCLFNEYDCSVNKDMLNANVIRVMANMLSDGIAPKLIWKHELITSKQEYLSKSKLRNNTHLENAITESGIDPALLLISDEKCRIKLVDDSEHERICIIDEGGSVIHKSFADSEASLFYILKDKSIYMDFVFYIGDCTDENVSKFLDIMNKPLERSSN
jgi:HD superfamily phosphohydrolase